MGSSGGRRQQGSAEDVSGQLLLSFGLLEGLRPIGGGELEQALQRPARQEAEQVAQVTERLNIVESGAGKRRDEDGIDLSAGVATDEEPVFAPGARCSPSREMDGEKKHGALSIGARAIRFMGKTRSRRRLAARSTPLATEIRARRGVSLPAAKHQLSQGVDHRLAEMFPPGSQRRLAAVTRAHGARTRTLAGGRLAAKTRRIGRERAWHEACSEG